MRTQTHLRQVVRAAFLINLNCHTAYFYSAVTPGKVTSNCWNSFS